MFSADSISQLVLYINVAVGFTDLTWRRTTLLLESVTNTRDIPIDIPTMTICIFGVVSNGLLLLAFFKDPLKCFRNSATHFVTNLSISDCLTCLFALFFYITANYMTAENRKIILFLQTSFAIVSLVSLTSISIDRFLMVAYPIKHGILMKGIVIVLCLAVIWIFGCSLSEITLLFDRQNKIYMYNGGAIIITISAVIYAATYHKLKRQLRNIALQNSSARDTNPERKEIFKHNHSYSMCRLPLHRAFHGVFSDL